MKTFLKHIIFLFAMAAGLSFALTSCGNLFESPSENKKESPTQEGSVAQNSKNCFITLSVNEANTRSALPELTLEDFTSFTLSGKFDGSTETDSEILGTYNSYDSLTQAKIAISAGKWTFTLSAKKGGAVYSGKTTATITEGENPLSFTLKLKSIAEEEGKGDFEIQVNLSSPEVSETAKITAELCTVNSDGTPGSVIFPEEELTINTEKRTTYKKSQIQNGTYTALFNLYNAEGTKVGSFIEYIGIAKDCKSTSSIGISSLECFTITYNPNAEGDTVTGITGRGSYSHYDEVSFPENPVRKGYDFGGWFTDEGCTGTKVTGTAGLSGNLTLYAKWTLTTYSITYVGVPAGITNPNEAITSYTIKSDDIKIKNISGEDILYYWYDAETDGNRVTEIESGSTGNVTLFAREITYVELKTGKEINDIFKKSLNAGGAISFDRSETAPEENDTVFYLDISESSVPVWYDSENKIIYYYVNNHILRLNEDSSGMFEGMTSLENITTFEFNTKFVKNMSSFFKGCKELKIIDVRSFNTSAVTDMSYMFCNCTKLESLDLKTFSTYQVTNFYSMFRGCSSIESLDLTSFKITNGSTMDYMFSGCNNLKSLYLNQFYSSSSSSTYAMFQNCSNLVSLELKSLRSYDVHEMFSGCSSLQSLDLKSFNTSQATNMQYMFRGCKSLQSLNLKSLNTSQVKNMSYMFRNCSSLESLDLSSFNTTNVTNMAFMFEGCKNLKSVLTSFDTKQVTTTKCMFSGCKSLETLDLRKFTIRKITDMTDMFSDCEKLKKIYVSSTTNWVLESIMYNNSSIPDGTNMFSGCTSLVGYQGTVYDSNMTNIEYAKIDEGPSNPGYFSVYTLDILSGSNINNLFLQTLNASTATSFKKSSSKPTNATAFLDEEKKISVWFDEETKTIYYYPEESASIRLPSDCSYMFREMNNLEEIDLSDFDASNVTKISNMFEGCTALKSLTIDGHYNNKITNIDDFVRNCNNLESITLQRFDFANIPDYSYLNLYEKNKLTHIDLSNSKNIDKVLEKILSAPAIQSLNLSNCSAKYLSGTFEYSLFNKTLTSINLKNFDTTNITNLSYMFSGCKALTTINFEGFDTSGVTNMKGMFKGCSSLSSIDLSALDTSKVTNMNAMFSNCSSLSYMDLTNVDTTSVEDVKYMFEGAGTTTLEIKGLDTSNITDMTGMFANCNKLETLTLDGFNFENVNTFGENKYSNMIAQCENLKSLILKNSKRIDILLKDYVISKEKITSLTLKKCDTSDITDMSRIFEHFSSLKELNLSDFDTSSVTNMSFMFTECSSLETLDLGIFDTRNVTDMTCMFKGCSSLETLDLGIFDTSNVTDMNCMFSGCSSLKTIDISNFNTGKVKSMAGMFLECDNLESVDLSTLDTSDVQSMESMFERCSDLESLDLSTFDTSNVKNMNRMFYGCNSLENLNLSNFDFRKALNSENINSNTLLSECGLLKSIDLSNAKFGSNMSYFLAGCNDLQSINLQNCDTTEVTNMKRMFAYCSCLNEIDLTDFNIDNIKSTNGMFDDCSNLQTIYTSEDTDWSTSTALTDSEDMFNGCVHLRGEKDTVYDENKTDKSYARVDGGPDAPGYFSVK